MSDFADILGDVVRIVTFQPREARMRYRPQEWEEIMLTPERTRHRATQAAEPLTADQATIRVKLRILWNRLT